jgi:hypothetical protein
MKWDGEACDYQLYWKIRLLDIIVEKKEFSRNNSDKLTDG